MKSHFFILCVVLFQLYSVQSQEARAPIVYEIGSPLILNCTADSPVEEVKWMKDGSDVVAKDNLIEMTSENGVHYLKYNKPKEHEHGIYTCHAGSSSHTFTVYMAPIIGKFAASANVVEGDNFRLLCEVFGYPQPVVEWTKDDEKLPEDERYDVSNNTLTIKGIKPEDRAHYNCTANNGFGVYHKQILVRVIDKHAALWPFLGICAEVAVLCAIIFIYEKRRSKAEFDESDADHNDTKNAANAKESEVRQRK